MYRRLTLGVLVGALLLLAGCGGISDRAPNPITLKDTSPGRLDAYFSLSMGGYDEASRTMTTIDISLVAGGRPVKFIAGEQVTCNGRGLQQYIGAFEARLPTEPVAGKPLACTYRSGGHTATISLIVPNAPAILAPADAARIPRAAHVQVSYRLAPGSLIGIVALGPRSKALPLASMQTATSATFDTSGFAPGPGSIALTQQLALSSITSAGFRSFHAHGEALAITLVSWT